MVCETGVSVKLLDFYSGRIEFRSWLPFFLTEALRRSPQSLQANVRILYSNRPRPPPGKSLPMIRCRLPVFSRRYYPLQLKQRY